MIMPSLNQPIDLALTYLYVLALYLPAQQPTSYAESETLYLKLTFVTLLVRTFLHVSARREPYSQLFILYTLLSIFLYYIVERLNICSDETEYLPLQ